MSRLGALILLVLCLYGHSASAVSLRPVKTTDYSIGLIADWHGGGSSATDSSRLGDVVVAWFAAQTPKPMAVLHAGDIYAGGRDPSTGHTGWENMQATFAAYGLPVYTCLGNHDFNYWNGRENCPGTDELYPAGTIPDSVARSDILGSNHLPYYCKDFGAVRVLFLDNMRDTTSWSGSAWIQNHAMVNPPGRDLAYWQAHGYPTGNQNGTNPEYAGWVTSDSTAGQLKWIKDSAAGFGGTFLLAVAHFSPYHLLTTTSAYMSDRGGRYVGWAICSRAGVDLAITGHTHCYLLTKRLYKGVQSAGGTYFFNSNIAGPRYGSFTGSACNADDALWPSAEALAGLNQQYTATCGLITFHGNRATLRVVSFHLDDPPVEQYTLNMERKPR